MVGPICSPSSFAPKFPLPSPSQPLSAGPLAEYALTTAVARTESTAGNSFAHVLWSVAESVISLPLIEKPGEKGGHGIHVERTVLDAFIPLNATISLVCAGARNCLLMRVYVCVWSCM